MNDDGPSVIRSAVTRLEYESSFGLDRIPHPPIADPADDKGDSLEAIAAEISSCTKCSLNATRTNTVPGEGYDGTEIVFVGEAPGRDEDLQGRPFVGRAGKLLDKMMAAIGLDRNNAFIANVLKCRPPGNRSPAPSEMAACIPFLRRQLRLIRPKVVCALGAVATGALLERPIRIGQIRGTKQEMGEYIIVPTFHPAYLLRNASAKKEAWHDLKVIKSILTGEG